jgi:hypothetical protein
MANEKLLQFYSGEGTDDRGRSIADIWCFSHGELERVHDYIQWLFPLAEKSAFNPGAPLLDAETIRRFQEDDTLRRNVERSLGLMLDFYGLSLVGNRIVRAKTFAERSRNWLTPQNHNFLRLTRVLKSLSLLGHGPRAKQLLACLEEIQRDHPRITGTTTLAYWRDAV